MDLDRSAPWAVVVVVAVVACGGPPAAPDASGLLDALPRADAVATVDAPSERDATVLDTAAEPDAPSPSDAGPTPPRATTERLTDQHRFVPGAMFGGWGPHLGHLVRTGGALYWVDDLCDQASAGDCDVNVNRRVGVFRRDAGGWTRVGTVPLAGVQQNTGTLAVDGTLRSYGVDVSAGRLVECTYTVATAASACAQLPFPLGASANYVGAALSPTGSRVVWWTNVVDGGGGSFSYVVDYGGGWNGPRTGPIGGYNDCAYAHASFAPTGPAMTLFGQVVSGLAPAWSFSTLVGEASLATTDAPAWSNALAPPAGDTIASTNDLLIDDATGDTHLLARSTAGGVVYYHRPVGGAWSGPVVVAEASFRARWLVTRETIAIVSGPNVGDLELRRFARDALTDHAPLPIGIASVDPITLPADFGAVLAIYPEADVYQDDDVGALDLVVVGRSHENEALYVLIEP